MAEQSDTAYWATDEYRKQYSQKERDEMSKNGQAMPDGSFPIKDAADLDNAIRLAGNSNNAKPDVIAHIKKRAKALGLTSQLPEDWRSADQPVSKRKVRKRLSARPPEVRDSRHHFLTAERLEVREADQTGDYVLIAGEPIVYNAPYTVVDMFGEFEERMLPGVASDVIARNADVRFLLNHTGMPFARTESGTMRLEDTSHGLKISAKLSTRSHAAGDLIDCIQRGDINAMSCGFIVAPGGDTWNESGDQRSISRFADLLDVSAVTYPASPTTSVEVAQRMLMGAPIDSYTRLEKMLVDVRAGKVLSADNQAKLVSAVQTLHEVLVSGGVNPQDIIDPDNDGDDDTSEATDIDADASADSPQEDPVTSAEDASGARSAEQHPASQDPDDVKQSSVRTLELEKELLALRRRRG